MPANEWVAYSVRARLWDIYGRRARIKSILVRNSSTADLTEHHSGGLIETGERKRLDYPGGADYVMLKADAATSDGDVTADLEIEVP